MPDDDRLDLSHDLEKIGSDLLKDVQAASKEVQQRKAKIAAEDAREAGKAQSRKTSMVLIAVGAVVVLLISYWMVFARPADEQPRTPMTTSQTTGTQAKGTAITNSGATPSTTPTTPPRAGGSVAGQGSQVVEHPSDEYEQPSDDGGM